MSLDINEKIVELAKGDIKDTHVQLIDLLEERPDLTELALRTIAQTRGKDAIAALDNLSRFMYSRTGDKTCLEVGIECLGEFDEDFSMAAITSIVERFPEGAEKAVLTVSKFKNITFEDLIERLYVLSAGSSKATKFVIDFVGDIEDPKLVYRCDYLLSRIGMRECKQDAIEGLLKRGTDNSLRYIGSMLKVDDQFIDETLVSLAKIGTDAAVKEMKFIARIFKEKRPLVSDLLAGKKIEATPDAISSLEEDPAMIIQALAYEGTLRTAGDLVSVVKAHPQHLEPVLLALINLKDKFNEAAQKEAGVEPLDHSIARVVYGAFENSNLEAFMRAASADEIFERRELLEEAIEIAPRLLHEHKDALMETFDTEMYAAQLRAAAKETYQSIKLPELAQG